MIRSRRHSPVLQALSIVKRLLMRASSLVRPVRMTRTSAGILMRCDTRDFVQRRIHYFGIFEHGLTRLLGERLQDGDVVIDVGANVGYVSLLAASLVGDNGMVLAIEADPNTFQELALNASLNSFGNIEMRQVAVTERPCQVSMEQPDRRNSGAGSVTVDEEGTVEGFPLRQIDLKVMHVANFIKIDVEGAEEPILAEILSELPEMSQRLTLAVEVHDHTAQKLQEFRHAGFDVYILPNDYAIEEYLLQARAPAPHRHSLIATDKYVPGEHDYVLIRR